MALSKWQNCRVKSTPVASGSKNRVEGCNFRGAVWESSSEGIEYMIMAEVLGVCTYD
jgi:hypothetical protein